MRGLDPKQQERASWKDVRNDAHNQKKKKDVMETKQQKTKVTPGSFTIYSTKVIFVKMMFLLHEWLISYQKEATSYIFGKTPNQIQIPARILNISKTGFRKKKKKIFWIK